jgi:hypothetical protein
MRVLITNQYECTNYKNCIREFVLIRNWNFLFLLKTFV